MKIKYIAESIFKTPEEAKKKLENKSNTEKALAAGRQHIQTLASKRFDDEFKEYIIGVNSIFDKSWNDVKCNNIKYYFIGNVLYCEFEISIGREGYGINSGCVELKISYPENIIEIENSLKEEYGCETKVKLHLVPPDNAKNSPIFTTDSFYYEIGRSKTISLVATDDTDLTNFCHMLNCIDGLNYSEVYTLFIDCFSNGKDIERIDSSEELKQKFQTVKLIGFYIDQITGLDKILSNKPCNKLHNSGPFYRGRSDDIEHIPNYTGVLILRYDDFPAPVHNMNKNWTLEEVIDLIHQCNFLANSKFSMYSNLLLFIYIRGGYANRNIAKDLAEYQCFEKPDDELDSATNLSMYLSFDMGGNVKLFNAHSEPRLEY